MLYQLPNGKVINISIEAYLKMSDDDLRYLSEHDFGSSTETEDPFNVTEDDAESIYIVDDYPIDEIPDELDLSDDNEE